MRKILIFLVFFLNTQILLADSSHFIDFKYILNESDAGKKAQDALKSQLQNGLKNLKEREKKIQEDEKKIIQQKKNELVIIVTPTVLDDQDGGSYGYGYRPSSLEARQVMGPS